jgi:hypothetical protein
MAACLLTSANDALSVVKDAPPAADILFTSFSEMDDGDHLPGDAGSLLNLFVDELVSLDFPSDSI